MTPSSSKVSKLSKSRCRESAKLPCFGDSLEGKEGEGERYTRIAWASPTGKRRQTSRTFIVVAVVWSGAQSRR